MAKPYVPAVALLLVAAVGCAQPDQVREPTSLVLTEAQAMDSLLTAADLPGVWEATEVPGTRAVAASGDSDCPHATRALTEAARAWDAASVDVEAAYESVTADGDKLLKQEVASDQDLEAVRLGPLLTQQAAACRAVVIASGALIVESQMKACDLNQGGAGIEVVQSWSTSDGRSGLTRFGYIFRGHVLVVLTLAGPSGGRGCREAEFDRIVAMATAKLRATSR